MCAHDFPRGIKLLDRGILGALATLPDRPFRRRELLRLHRAKPTYHLCWLRQWLTPQMVVVHAPSGNGILVHKFNLTCQPRAPVGAVGAAESSLRRDAARDGCRRGIIAAGR